MKKDYQDTAVIAKHTPWSFSRRREGIRRVSSSSDAAGSASSGGDQNKPQTALPSQHFTCHVYVEAEPEEKANGHHSKAKTPLNPGFDIDEVFVLPQQIEEERHTRLGR